MKLAAHARSHHDLLNAETINGLSDSRDSHSSAAELVGPSDSIPTHSLGLKPLGNQYFATSNPARESIGSFQALPDETLMILLEFLDQWALRRLGYTCRFLSACCVSDELWKPLFLESRHDSKEIRWRGSWRSSLLGLKKDQEARLDCSNVFSDVLHRPFVCSHVSLARFSSNIPPSNQIQRFETLSYEDFASNWTEKPFIVTKCIQSWPVFGDWTMSRLLDRYGDVDFRAESVDWKFSTYYSYLVNNHDESPLYLFDRKFAEKMQIKVGQEDGAAYWKPECFGTDLFELLGQERPAHRWLIVGPARSGSTFHKDPNGTSAWNAVLEGTKYWIMFPPTTHVPGVYVSKDSSEVTSPLSIAEWLLEFHAEARSMPGCVEGICSAGEILHVPSGWWHLVVNLESAIALTQNFVPESPSLYHLSEVLAFLRDKPDQVTGFKRETLDPYQLFVDRLEKSYPDLLRRSMAILEQKTTQKKRKWDVAIGAGEEERSSGFSFGFGFGGEDDDEIP